MEAIIVTLSSVIFIAGMSTVIGLSTVQARGNRPAPRQHAGAERG